MQLLKSVNVFFSEDTWLRGSTGLGIILIKIIYMSCHKFPVLWLCLLLLGFWMNRFGSSLSLDWARCSHTWSDIHSRPHSLGVCLMEPAFLREPPFHSPVLETMQARSGGAGGLSQLLDSISSHDCLLQQCPPQHPALGGEWYRVESISQSPHFFSSIFLLQNWYQTQVVSHPPNSSGRWAAIYQLSPRMNTQLID